MNYFLLSVVFLTSLEALPFKEETFNATEDYIKENFLKIQEVYTAELLLNATQYGSKQKLSKLIPEESHESLSNLIQDGSQDGILKLLQNVSQENILDLGPRTKFSDWLLNLFNSEASQTFRKTSTTTATTPTTQGPLMFSDFAEEGLAAHNARRLSSPHYRSLLSLDMNLCMAAQVWADFLSLQDAMMPDPDTDQGESIAVDWSGASSSAGSVVAGWYKERNTGEDCMEHYTRMVWKNTKYLCMARARSQSGAWFTVARYWPKGPHPGTSVKEYRENVHPQFRKHC